MGDVLIDSKLKLRNQIFDLEKNIANVGNHFKGDSDYCPLKHSFADGIYVREIFIPAGTILTGKIHKHSHPNFLLKGIVDVVTEGAGLERIEGPRSIISEAGTKRALHAITDLVWVTVHLNLTNTEDLKEIEKDVIAENYKEYNRFIEFKKNKFVSIYNKIIKKLIL